MEHGLFRLQIFFAITTLFPHYALDGKYAQETVYW
jgi:hypothetical protein